MMKRRQVTRGNSLFGGLAAATVMTALAVPFTAAGDERAFIVTADSPQLEWGPCPEFMPEGCVIAVLQGNPAEPNADVFFKLPSGSTAPLHWHTSAERMVLVEGEMEVAYEGQDPVVLKSGTYAYGPSRAPHDATCTSSVDCVLFIAFNEPVDAHAGR